MVKSTYYVLVVLFILITSSVYGMPGDFVVPMETNTGFTQYQLDGVEDLRKVMSPAPTDDGAALSYDLSTDSYIWKQIVGDMSRAIYDSNLDNIVDSAQTLTEDLTPDMLLGDTINDNLIDDVIISPLILRSADIDTKSKLESVSNTQFWTKDEGDLLDDNVTNDLVETMMCNGLPGEAPICDGAYHLVMSDVVVPSEINTKSKLESVSNTQFWTKDEGDLLDDNVTNDLVETMITNGDLDTAPLSDGSHHLSMIRVVRKDEIDDIYKLNAFVGVTFWYDEDDILSKIRVVTSGDFHNIGGIDDDIPDSDAEVPDDITIGPHGHVDPNALPANILYDTSIDTEYELENILHRDVIFNDELGKWGSPQNITISSGGNISPTAKYNIIDTYSGTSIDEIISITYSGSVGDILIFRAANDTHTVIFRNNSNVHIGSDFVLDSQYDVICLMYIGSGNWIKLFANDNS